jgi:hypothetical protein
VLQQDMLAAGDLFTGMMARGGTAVGASSVATAATDATSRAYNNDEASSFPQPVVQCSKTWSHHLADDHATSTQST